METRTHVRRRWQLGGSFRFSCLSSSTLSDCSSDFCLSVWNVCQQSFCLLHQRRNPSHQTKTHCRCHRRKGMFAVALLAHVSPECIGLRLSSFSIGSFFLLSFPFSLSFVEHDQWLHFRVVGRPGEISHSVSLPFLASLPSARSLAVGWQLHWCKLLWLLSNIWWCSHHQSHRFSTASNRRVFLLQIRESRNASKTASRWEEGRGQEEEEEEEEMVEEQEIKGLWLVFPLFSVIDLLVPALLSSACHSLGDWLWPAFWMLPRYHVYGKW